MSTSKNKPSSNVTRLETALKAKSKKDSVLIPADNILSVKTSGRLDDIVDLYQKGTDAIITATVAESKAMAAAIPQRKLLNSGVGHFIKSLNLNISEGTIPRSARAYYGLDVNNDKTPYYNTDIKLLKICDTIMKGDKERTDAGGIVIILPTILQFKALYDVAKPIINTLSNTKVNLSIAQKNLRLLNPEMDDVIEHVWNEAETEYSKLEPSARRAICRQWSVRYISIGDLSDVIGKCIDTVTRLPIEGVILHITGSSKKVISNDSGDYDDPTTMYGDLDLIATHTLYHNVDIAFVKENGVNNVINVEMVKK